MLLLIGTVRAISESAYLQDQKFSGPALYHQKFYKYNICERWGRFSEAVSFLLNSRHSKKDDASDCDDDINDGCGLAAPPDGGNYNDDALDEIVVKIETPPEDLRLELETSVNGDTERTASEDPSPEDDDDPSDSSGRHPDQGGQVLPAYPCSHCGLGCSSRKSLRQHRKVVHASSRTLGGGRNLTVKRRVGKEHSAAMPTDEPPVLQCEFCAKSFGNACGLSKHLKIHSGLKPYKCGVCEKAFLHAAHLKNHARVHTGEKPYQVQFFFLALFHSIGTRYCPSIRTALAYRTALA